MIDILIKNETGSIPVALAISEDQIDSEDLTVINLDPVKLILVGYDYIVGLDDGSNMIGRTCVSVRGTTATFAK
jgi:hypothetical protein